MLKTPSGMFLFGAGRGGEVVEVSAGPASVFCCEKGRKVQKCRAIYILYIYKNKYNYVNKIMYIYRDTHIISTMIVAFNLVRVFQNHPVGTR